MNNNPSQRPPVVVGTVAIDAVHLCGVEGRKEQVHFRFGGVCGNAARALGVLGLKPRFVSTHFSGELGGTIEHHLSGNGVVWLPLSSEAPLPFYQVKIDVLGNIYEEVFYDDGALDQLTSYALQEHMHAFNNAGAIVSCTDLSIDSLDKLQVIAQEQGAPFWLISSSVEEVWKVNELRFPVDALGLNLAEIERLTGNLFQTPQDIARATRQLIAKPKISIVTLGPEGVVLCLDGESQFYYQEVPKVFHKSTIGAGDILFACLLAAFMTGQKWDVALRFATASTMSYITCDRRSRMPYQSILQPCNEIALPQRISL